MDSEPIDVDADGPPKVEEPKREQSSDSDIVPLSVPPPHLADQARKPKSGWDEPETPGDAWEVAYTWAFIVKFDLLKDIKGLESVEDLESGLLSWVPDEVLENTLILFLGNLRPGLATKLDAASLQGSLSRYIHDQLVSTTEFTVWDAPWKQEETSRGLCCHPEMDEEERHSMGRLSDRGESARGKLNPMQGWEDGNGGLWSMKWYDRAKLLRQLVDWQLTYCGDIRETIKEHYKIKNQVNMNFDPKSNPLMVTPVGHDRDKNRVWNLDGSARFYSSGNPFKRPSPLVAYTRTKSEVLAKISELEAYRDLATPKEDAILSAKRGKANRADVKKARKVVTDKEVEGKLAAAMQALLPEIEKHEQKIARAQRKLHQAATMAALVETRGTRTRRQANKPDYVYDGIGDDDRRGKRRYDEDEGSDDSHAASSSIRPVIPGERRSTRVAGISKPETAPSSRHASRENSVVPPSAGGSSGSGGNKKRRGMKGYAWVDDGGDENGGGATPEAANEPVPDVPPHTELAEDLVDMTQKLDQETQKLDQEPQASEQLPSEEMAQVASEPRQMGGEQAGDIKESSAPAGNQTGFAQEASASGEEAGTTQELELESSMPQEANGDDVSAMAVDEPTEGGEKYISIA